ncbi:cilia- and flagella-associated protein 57-like [Pieris rapae]|uniref:cilia- and flagella-associated protein 57-like n=1 Tax=Pieris rapae TaxID=64459 RepID=UPI001E280009|nr:cilia- and flagella-associated protein 57-like [Pieris rapae]
MDDYDIPNLDTEYKRYLQIMRPYLGQLLDQEVIRTCNAWIQKLSDCKEGEKVLRNKYIFTLCYQLARGILEEPFLKAPSKNYLSPLPDDSNSDESSTEIECVVINKDTNTRIIYNNPKTPLTAVGGDEHCYNDTPLNSIHNISKHTHNLQDSQILSQDILLNDDFQCLCNENEKGDSVNDAKYKCRVGNLIKKLRQIKKQNMLLHNELHALKEKSESSLDNSQDVLKVNNEGSTKMSLRCSHTHVNSLKCKLQEVQDSKNTLIDTISNLQETLDFFHSMKSQEIQEIEAKHKLEIIKLKTSIREEITTTKDKEVEDLKNKYDDTVKNLQIDNLKQIESIKRDKDAIILEKDKIIQNKESEILQLKSMIDEMKRSQLNCINKMMFDKPDTSESSSSKTEELERRLNKMERAKYKNIKSFECKLAQLQRQKHLAECSLQLQLMKQRTQVVTEVTDENQIEITAALGKLEEKYKEIVASVQATAVQRRMQDQIALDSLIQAICGAHDKNLQGASQFQNKTMRNSNKSGNQTCDIELSPLFHGNKVGSVVVGKPFGDDSIVNEYCLDSEKLGELFERVHIPQRDTGDTLTKN